MENFYGEVVVSEKAITYRTAKAEAQRFYSDESYRESLPWSEPIRQWRGDPVAYTYDAATHCPDCTGLRFTARDDLGFIPESVTDSEGNGIGAIFPWDTSDWPEGIYCDDCHREISEPSES